MNYINLADELFRSFVKLSKTQFRKEASEFSKGELAVLDYLYEQADGVTAGGLRKISGVGSGRMADTLKALEAKGLILRRRDRKDRRLVYVFITDSGRDFVRSKYSRTLEHISVILGKMGEEDAKEFVRISKKLVGISNE